MRGGVGEYGQGRDDTRKKPEARLCMKPEIQKKHPDGGRKI